MEQLPLQVEQTSFVPGLGRSALPRCHRRDAPSAVTQPGYSAKMALLDRRAFPMLADSGGHGCKPPLPVAEGVAGKPGCTTGGRNQDFRDSSHRPFRG